MSLKFLLRTLAYSTAFAFTIMGTFTLFMMNFTVGNEVTWYETNPAIRLIEIIVGIYATLFIVREIKREVYGEVKK